MTIDELNALLEAVEKHYPGHYALILLLARTGLRIGEALALEWGDIDFNSRFIEVRRSTVREKISTPKSGKIRRVDMSLQYTKTLKFHMLKSKKKGFEFGFGDKPEYIFTNNLGGIIDKNNWRRRVFKKAFE